MALGGECPQSRGFVLAQANADERGASAVRRERLWASVGHFVPKTILMASVARYGSSPVAFQTAGAASRGHFSEGVSILLVPWKRNY